MPPKAKAAGKKPDAKAKAAKAQKVVEDKTFGLKNKSKSKVVQKYVQQLQASQRPSAKDTRLAEPSRKERKRQEEERQRELDELFMISIKQPKVPPGVDPKTMVCEYFRVGKCTKGFKCKFSHDLSIERKGPKLSIYQDTRDAGAPDESMEDWDQATLEEAVKQKHGSEATQNRTEIVCKYFLEAVENKKYGWLWQCPNGKGCIYRHALPPGFVLKSQMKELLEAEAANAPSVEEMIEEERSKVDAHTKITEDIFRKWREEKARNRLAEDAEKEAERRRLGLLTGREIFEEEGFVARDDAGASDAAGLAREIDEEAEFKRIEEEASKAREQAHKDAGAGAAPAEGAGGEGDGQGAGQGGGGGGATAAVAALTDAEKDALFDDDDDDDDDDDETLDALAAELEAKAKA